MNYRLIDTIGKETGMHLYDEAFVKGFEDAGKSLVVLSNYEDDNVKPLIKNFYHRGKVGNISFLLLSLFRMFCYRLNHIHDIFIYQSFGLRFIDILFILLFWGDKRFFVVVHDVYEITDANGIPFGIKYKIQKWTYQHCIKNVICHSHQSIEVLKKDAHFTGNIIYFPHLRYCFDKTYKVESLSQEVLNTIEKNKINCLFFGQLRPTKGVDVLKDAINILKDNEDINIIVAGQDKARLMIDDETPKNVRKILRRIDDNELNYLFSMCDVVLLPYKEIYQSGVVESVIHFGKFAIMSDCRAFKELITLYPSFGVTYSPNNGETLASCIIEQINQRRNYEKVDIDRYSADHDVKILIKKIDEILLK